MEYICYKGDDELYHWGIKGMRWGVRRFQNKDGSLTAAGRKHRAALESGTSKKSAVKSKTKTAPKKTTKVKPEEAPKKKSLSEMSDTEIRDGINRMYLEKQYHDAAKSLAASNPKQVSKGRKFLDSVLNDVVAPAAKDVGRKWLTNFMEDKLGLNKKTELQRLEESYKKLDFKKKISDLKKGINDNDEGAEVARLEREWKKADFTKKIYDLENPKDDDPYGLKDLEGRAKRAKSEYEIADYNNKKDNVGKTQNEKPDWESKNKEQKYYQDSYKTVKAERDYRKYLEEVETLGEEAAFENWKKKQG